MLQIVVEDQDDVDYLASKNSEFDAGGYEGYWLRCKDDEVEGQWTCGDSPNYWNSDVDNQGLWGKRYACRLHIGLKSYSC